MLLEESYESDLDRFVEKEIVTTLEAQKWKTLTFDFSSATGQFPLNPDYLYDIVRDL